MIKSRAIRDFLARKRRDFRKFKTYSLEQLEEMQQELPFAPPIWSKLRKHQKVCFLIGAQEERFAFHLDTGMGKTLLSIALQRYFRKAKLLTRRCLVLVPNRGNKYEWKREIKKHSPLTTCTVLKGSSVRKWEQLEGAQTDIVIETYAGLARMVSVPKKNRKGKVKLRPVASRVNKLVRLFDMLVMDESTQCKNHKTLPYRICRRISKFAKYVFALTGTPFGNDPTDLWAQLFIVDRGETLGETLGLFRAAFFKEVETPWRTKYKFEKKKERLLNDVLANRTLAYEAAEGDLPKLQTIPVYINLHKDAHSVYEEAKDTLIAAQGNYEEMKNAFTRMRQISSGWVGYKDDETGRRAEYDWKPNPKLEKLLEILETIPRNRKVIVFHDFIFSGSIIEAALKKEGYGTLRLWGGTQDSEKVLEEFDRDASKQILILNSQAGGFGLNLQIAQYGIFFEAPVGTILAKQTVKRYHRQFSRYKKVFRYDLIVRGTYDQKILNNHASGIRLFDAIIRDKRTALTRRAA